MRLKCRVDLSSTSSTRPRPRPPRYTGATKTKTKIKTKTAAPRTLIDYDPDHDAAIRYWEAKISVSQMTI